MIYTTIILLPMLVVMGLMIQFHVRKRQWIPLVVVPTLIAIFIGHCLVMTSKWYLKEELSDNILEARAWTTCLIFPLIYIFMCSKSGEKLFSINTVTVLLFTFFNFSNGITLYLDNIYVEPFPLDNKIHLMAGGKAVFNMSIYEFVLLLQMCWILARVMTLYKKTKNNNQHFSKKSILLFKTIAIGFFVSFLAVLIPDKVWETSVLFPWVFFIPMSVCFTYAELLASWGYALAPIIDENGEPAMNTVGVDESVLIKELRRLVEDGKLYLDGDLRLEDVAMKLNTNRNHISKVVNEQFGCNFSTYVNGLRIKDIEKVLKSDPNANLEELALRYGFNSAGSFTKVFKKILGYNPSIYKKRLASRLQ